MEDCKTKLTAEQRKKLREMIKVGPMMKGVEMKLDQECDMKKKYVGLNNFFANTLE